MAQDPAPHPPAPLFSRGSWSETRRIIHILHDETVGGAILLAAATIALVWANSPWAASYKALTVLHVGTDDLGLHLNLTLSAWAADGLLAIFFFVVGLELKREFVAGDLRDPRRAALPIAAAIGGMVVPALIFAAFTAGAGAEATRGWAIPTATDIAFAVAVLAVISTHLPAALRTFLLTLAVVDDLLAITIIAVFYSTKVNVTALLLALIPLAIFAVLAQRRVRSVWLLLPLAVATWALVHESGIHATVAGVLLGFAVPVLRSERDGPGDGPGGYDGFVTALRDPVALGIVAGLVVGKTIGVFGTTRLLAAFTHASLDASLRWIDVFGVAILAGIGFTVSLLIGDLAYGLDSPRQDVVKVAVLTGSLLAALLAAVVLRARNRHYRAVFELETADPDHDGVPDVYQEVPGRGA